MAVLITRSSIAAGGGVSISSVTGSFTQGGTLTINGSGFSANRSGQILYENFDGGTTGQPISGDDVYEAGQYVYSTTSPFSGSRCARATWDFIQPGGLIYDLPDLTEVLVDYRCRIQIPTLGSTGDQQIKLGRLTGGHEGSHTNAPNIGSIWQMGNNTATEDHVGVYVGGVPGIEDVAFYGTNAPSLNTWERYTLYYKISTINTANGKRAYRTSFNPDGYEYSGSPGEFADSTDTQNREEINGNQNVITHATGDPYTSVGQLFLPFYQRDTMSSIVDVDCLFVNDSLERVEFGDNSNWLNCTARSRIIQPVQSRTSNEIVITAEVGNLTSPVYAFVFNADGTRNAVGYQVV